MAAAALLAAFLLQALLAHVVRARIEAAAARHGWVVHVARVRVGVWPLLRLTGVDLDPRPGAHFHVDSIAATWPGRLRLAVRDATLTGPAGITLASPATAWNVTGLVFGNDLKLTLVQPQAGLVIERRRNLPGSAWSVEANTLDVGRVLELKREGRALLDGGIAEGRVELRSGAGALGFHVDVATRGARLAALADSAADEPQVGEPTDATLKFDGEWRKSEGAIEIPKLDATVAGAAVTGSLALHDLKADATIDLALGVRQLDFARALGASGLAVPESLGFTPGSGSHDLGSATIDVRARGKLSDPASLAVTQKIAFKPPRQLPPAIDRLRGDFIYGAGEGAGSGPEHPVDVSPASPNFIALRDVPPLFVRTLLLAEDAGFYGHRGIDLRELPTAIVTNWTRGGAARGASTITQQLAKNLFLTREKQLGRKLEELAITFLLESAIGKNRILEIYLNIIEWGPGLAGLRPAARAYFGREPKDLTPAQMAFLVCIIPGPIKYQTSFAHGTPGPGLRALIDDLLAKLRSVDAISEEEYRRALEEEIVVGGGRQTG